MSAELIVVNGPLAGTHLPLDEGEILIGRAPGSRLVLNEAEIGWRHCQIRRQGARYMVTDLRSSLGTYVNGMRSAERWLEDRDQLGIGKTILLFRSGEAQAEAPAAAAATDAKPTLLAACSLVFLSRALASGMDDEENALLQNQILRLVGDLIPIDDGILLLGATAAQLNTRWAESAAKHVVHFAPAVVRVCEEGAFVDASLRVAGVPLYLAGALGGALLVRIAEREAPRLSVHLETLTAAASLISIGFEANREVETLRAENALLQEQIAVQTGIVGNSPVIRRLLDLIERVAPRDTTVLIAGESGTGKELVARALHQKSPRSERPFVAVNCAALSETLFESELFGHEKGAFTGAVALKRGRFELAQGGTIFLDEVGELAPGLQAKLLRVLQQREFERVGGTQAYPLDIRIIAATNRDLAADVAEGRFREDLYHRLNVVALQSPPLRDRKDDIPRLAEFFLRRSAERCKRHVEGLSPEVLQMVCQYSWPGNVRELENATPKRNIIIPWDKPSAMPFSTPTSKAMATTSKRPSSWGCILTIYCGWFAISS
jgi:two-component system response regulator HydG